MREYKNQNMVISCKRKIKLFDCVYIQSFMSYSAVTERRLRFACDAINFLRLDLVLFHIAS